MEIIIGFGTICFMIALFIIGAMFFISFFEYIDDGNLVGCIICIGISLSCFFLIFLGCCKLYKLKAAKNDDTESGGVDNSQSDIYETQETTEEYTIEINGQIYKAIPIQ